MWVWDLEGVTQHFKAPAEWWPAFASRRRERAPSLARSDRFRQVVARAIGRADLEIAAHHARIAALPTLPRESRVRIAELLRPTQRRP